MTGSKHIDSGEDLFILQDGSCLITGRAESYDGDFLHNNADTTNANLFVSKLSSSGDVIFTKIYGGNKDDYGYRIKPLQNGSFLILGSTQSNDGDVTGAHVHGIFEANPYYQDTVYNEEAWVLNIDGNGNLIWNKCYGGSGQSFFTGAINSNGGILLTGTTDSKNGDLPYYPESAVVLWVLQISNTGNITWSKLYKLYGGYSDSNYVTGMTESFYDNLPMALQKAKDGNFIVGARVSDKYGTIKTSHGKSDIALIKINPSGEIVWQKSIGGTREDILYSMIIDKNDDIVFVGSSRSDNDDLYRHSEIYHADLAVVGKIGITNIIKGQVFIDNNGNHIKDAGERFFQPGKNQFGEIFR